jgi:hypothetical protein
VATWDSCHIAFRGKCTPPPRSPSGYRNLCNKSTLTAEGVHAATCPVFMDTVHPDLRMLASDAQAFYAHTGCAVADVSVYDTKHGIFICGAMRPDATPEQVRAFRGSDISPDWRPLPHRNDMVALVAVNTSGFITPALVASAGTPAVEHSVQPGKARVLMDVGTGEVKALVAAGMVRHSSHLSAVSMLEELRAEVAQLRRQMAPMRMAHLAKTYGMTDLPVVANGSK